MKKLIEDGIVAVTLVFLLTSVVGFVLDRPFFISYAYSESMTPTINKGDLFFVNPLSKGGSVGDIVVFRRKDGWTVHRIFAVTEGGYITKGDHNVATDQQGGAYPKVKPSDVAGKVIQISNHPLVIRGGGDFIVNLRKRVTNVYAAVVILAFGVLLTFSGGGTGGRKRRRKFLKVRARTVYVLLSAGIIAGFLFVTVASWGTLAFTYSSTMAGGQRAGWYLPGTSFERNLTIENSALYPFHYFLENKSNRFRILNGKSFDVGGGNSHTVLIRVSVPVETSIYREEIVVHSYPAILPGSLVQTLYNINPYLPLLPYTIELMVILLAFYYLADVGRGEVLRIRIRRRSLLSRLVGDG